MTDVEEYIFSDADSAPELARLRRIEAIFDGASRRVLTFAKLHTGARCLEVGAGAGSIAGWLAREVGPGGRVVAIDVNPRFLPKDAAAPLQVVQADVREYDAVEAFDLVHARYVLVHMLEHERALERMVRALAPGGWLVLEEPDFYAARPASGPAELVASVERVNAAMHAMFEKLGLDPGLGLRLPGTLMGMGLEVVHVENDAPLEPGQSAIAHMMRASAEQLSNKYAATGIATVGDVANYCRFADDPLTWAVYYGTVRVGARRA